MIGEFGALDQLTPVDIYPLELLVAIDNDRSSLTSRISLCDRTIRNPGYAPLMNITPPWAQVSNGPAAQRSGESRTLGVRAGGETVLAISTIDPIRSIWSDRCGTSH